MRGWLITGVSGGIGRAIAKAALGRGDGVVGTVRRDEDVAAFEDLSPGRAHGLLLDVDQLHDIPAAVGRALELLGRIDVVVNNAGYSLFGAIEEATLEEVRGVFETNFFAPLAVIQAVLPHMRAAGGGTLVNISSGCGINAVPGIGTYSASKFALEGLSEALALEVGGQGVSVVIVEPGAIASRFISHGTVDSARRLEPYAPLSGGGKHVLDAYYETGAEPAESVAEALLAALEQETPPLRLLLGRDNRAMIRAKFEAMAALAQD